MEARTTATTLTAKLYILNLGEYDLWLTRIEQYFLMTDYSLWEVIKNGKKVLTKMVGAVEQTYEPISVEEKLDKKNEMKARGTLLIELLTKDQLIFHSYQDAKLLMEAIEKRYAGNKESKKVQRTLLKQQYENFAASSSETLDQSFDRSIWRADWSYQAEEEHLTNYALMALTSSGSSSSLDFESTMCLALASESFPIIPWLPYKAASPAVENFVNSSKMLENQENVKSRSDKGYHAVPSSYTVNYIPPKPDLIFIDEQVKSESMDVASNVISSAIKTVELEVESVDVKNKGVYCTIETKPVRKNNFGPLIIKDWISDDKSEVEIIPKVKVKIVRPSIENIKLVKSAREKVKKFNLEAYKAGLESVEARLVIYNKNEEVFEDNIKILKVDTHLRDNAPTELRKKLEKAEKERDEIKLTLEKFENSSKTLNKMLDSHVNDKYKTGIGYHAVPPPFTGNYMSPKPNLILADMDENVVSKPVTTALVVATSEVKTSESKPKSVSEPIIEEWESDSDEENEMEGFSEVIVEKKIGKPSFAKSEFVKSNMQVKPPRKSVKHDENNKQAKHPRKKPWQLGSQDAATPMMQGIIDLHHDIFFFLILILVFVSRILVRALWHFQKDKNLISQRIVHGTTIKILRTIFPSIIPMFIVIPSFALLYSMDEVVVNPAITIKAIRHQWYWSAPLYEGDLSVMKCLKNMVREASGLSLRNYWAERGQPLVPAPLSSLQGRRSYGSGEDKLKLKKLMELCTKLFDRVLDLEKTKTAQAKEITDLKKRVKKLERKTRSRTLGMNLFKIDTSKRRSLGEEDASKQGRNSK
nr:cytochrome c oxidase subunit 2, mitochondrial [Tanacetum cinerariifolium]